MNSDNILNYVFAGFLVLLLVMIFVNVIGAPRHRRRPRGASQRWPEAGDSSGGVDPGPLFAPRGKSRHSDGGGDDGGSSDGGDGGGGGGGD